MALESWHAIRARATQALPQKRLRWVALQRIDTNRNLWRYYHVWVRPDLFASAALICQWGRIGCSGQWTLRAYASWGEAEAAVVQIAQQKLRRGYVLDAVERSTTRVCAEAPEGS